MKYLKFSVLVHTPVTDEPFEAPAGVSISDEERIIYFDSEGLSLLSISISLASGITAQVVGAWLYERFVKPKDSQPAKETKLNERVLTVKTRDEFIHLVEREIYERTE